MENVVFCVAVLLLSFTTLTVGGKVPAKYPKCRLLQKEMHDPSDVLHPKGCLLKHYRTSDVVRCTEKMTARKDLNQKGEWHIAFMGDSRIRQMYHSFARLLPTEDLEITGHSDPRNYFTHQDALITSELLSLRVAFSWQTYPDNLTSVLQNWLDNPNTAPDLLITGQALWSLLFRDHSYENFTKAFEETAPLMKDLTQYTEIIWWDQDPLNERQYQMRVVYDAKADFNNARIKMYDGTVRRLLKNSGVRFWDSSDDLFNEYVRSCAVLPTRKDTWRHWICDDNVHSSFLYAHVYIQQLVNYMCNPVLKFGPKYCCNS